MSSSDELKIGDRVKMHPEWIQNCIEFLGPDSVIEEDYTMVGTIYVLADDEDVGVKWDNETYELVSPCNLMKAGCNCQIEYKEDK